MSARRRVQLLKRSGGEVGVEATIETVKTLWMVEADIGIDDSYANELATSNEVLQLQARRNQIPKNFQDVSEVMVDGERWFIANRRLNPKKAVYSIFLTRTAIET